MFDGTVEAIHQATVSAQTAGRIAEVGYDVDDFVEAGSVLVRFTDVEQSTALRQAEAGDVVLVAGKGHETTQDIGGELKPFNDAAIARGLMEEMEDRRDR